MALLLALFLFQNDARSLVEKLDADRIEDRNAAEKALQELGKEAVAELRRAEKTATGEFAIRIKRALRRALLADPLVEKLLVTLEPGKFPRFITFSAAGHLAYFGPKNNHIVIDGVPGEEFDVIVRFSFSPDGRTLAAVAKRDGGCFAVIGERVLGPYSTLGHNRLRAMPALVFSPDGKRFAFRVMDDGKVYMVVDGRAQGPFTDVDHPVFSPDGAHIAYAANRGGEYDSLQMVTGGKWFIVVDGKPQPEEFDSVGLTSDPVFAGLSPTFSPDGKRMAYRAGAGKKQFVMVDGKKELEADLILGLRFSSDSRHLAYQATTNQRDSVILDNRPLGEFDGAFFDFAFSPDCSRLLFPASSGSKKWAMVLDGVKGDDYEAVSLPCFSDDGKRTAYIAKDGLKRFVVVDGKRGPSYEAVGAPRFEEDGTDVYYLARAGGKFFVVRNGKPQEEFDLILTEESFSPFPLTRTPKSSTLLYRARRGDEWFVVIGDRKSGPYDYVWIPRFSADGRRAMFGARKGTELWWKVVDVP